MPHIRRANTDDTDSDEQAHLVCPKCRNGMQEDGGNASVFHCLGCAGVWQRRGQLEAFLRASASARGVVLEAVGMLESPPLPTTFKCPDCSLRYLEAVRYRGIEVDRCPGCRGVYADADEREQIAERLLKARSGWESALREWQTHAVSQRRPVTPPRSGGDVAAGLLGMALAGAMLDDA